MAKTNAKPKPAFALKCADILEDFRKSNTVPHTLAVRLATGVKSCRNGTISYNMLIALMETIGYETNLKFTLKS